MAPKKTNQEVTLKPDKVNWQNKLRKLEGAVEGSVDIHKEVLRSRSPSVNALFGNGWGLPRGYSLLLAGPPKGGKTTLKNDFIGQAHADYPNGVVVNYGTEFKEKAEMDEAAFRKWGIDRDRYICYERNDPKLFDSIINELQPLVQDGMPLVLLCIDSVNNIQGRRMENSDSISDFLIGDQAQTLQDGMMRILPFLRRYNIACILTCHVGAEMDRTEQMRGNTMRMKVAHGFKHRVEYWAFVEPNLTAAGKQNLNKETYIQEGAFVTPKGEKEQIDVSAHRIKVVMKAASFAPVGRVAEFTYDYRRGIVAQEEEVFKLAENNGVIRKVEGNHYAYADQQWHGLPKTLEALRDPKLSAAILLDLHKKDLAQKYVSEEAAE